MSPVSSVYTTGFNIFDGLSGQVKIDSSGIASIALNTIVAFVLSSLGILFSRPDRGVMSNLASDRGEGVVTRRTLPETLEKRLDEIEKMVAELGAIVGARAHRKDWLATVGTLPDDELSREADRLGREYRNDLNHSDDRVGA